MIEHAVRVGAKTARERVPQRIADALAADALAEAEAGLFGADSTDGAASPADAIAGEAS